MDSSPTAKTPAPVGAQAPAEMPAPTETPAPTKTPAPTGASRQAPPGYKFVKVRQADGSLATVKRKLSPAEGASETTPTAGSAPTTGASSATDGSPKFKIVTVRKADGTLVKVRRPIAKSSELAVNDTPALNNAESQKVMPSVAATDPKPTADKSVPAATAVVEPGVATAAISPVPGDSRATTAVTKPTGDVKDTHVVDSTNADSAKVKTKAVSSEPRSDERELADALAEQDLYNRQKRTHRFKSSLLRGLGVAVGSALPSMEISGHFEDGDEIMSDDDDWSIDEGDDDDDNGADNDEHDLSDELHKSAEADHASTQESDNGGTHVTFDAGAALGGLAATAAANAAAQPPPPPPGAQAAARAAQNGTTTSSDSEKEKQTYKITAKEIADIENASADKFTEKKLNRHFANATFYFMASLSIVLPSLFLMLAGFIGGMRNKPVTSNWSKMENPIKVAVSAWPIVFAAVVAQCFKAWATFKVERGIKLMELEQLVGSSSFASAMKQPILLRRMDLLTLVLFAVWCLSPIGSQALVRVYSTERHLINDNTTVLYVPSYGHNRLFTPNATYTALAKTPDHAEVVQLVASYYIAALSPDALSKTYTSDPYEHPVMLDDDGMLTQAYGALLTYPISKLKNDNDAYNLRDASDPNPKYETLSFDVTYSYFSFSCDPWKNLTRYDLDKMQNDSDYLVSFTWSNSGTLAVAFTTDMLNQPDNTTDNSSIDPAKQNDITGIRLASANSRQTYNPSKNDTEQDWERPDFPFSYIQCGLKQEFRNATVDCYTEDSLNSRGTSDIPDCYPSSQVKLEADYMKDSMKTTFMDFSDLFVATPGGDAEIVNSPATLSEIYLQTGWSLSGDTNSTMGQMTLSANITELQFAQRFGYLFNTLLGMGYCPECVNKFNTSWTDNGTTWSKLYKPITAERQYARDLKYVVNPGWLAGFTVCAAILWLAGIAGVAVESMTVAPDVLGYVSTVARNSRYLQLPKVSSAMSGGERAKTMGGVKVMMQDVKGNAKVGKIALGLKHENAQRLKPDRLYR